MESRVEALTWPRANRNAAALPPNPAARGLRRGWLMASLSAPPPPKHVVDSGASTRQQSEGSVSSGVRKCTRGRRRRSTPPLASVPPSSRPKLAAGTSNQHRQVIQDIDVLDVDNQLGVADYIEDIYKFYKVAENECRPCDYIYSQADLGAWMRGILVDWIIEAHEELDLMPETLYLAVYIIDRYLSMQPVLRGELQLVGSTSLLIACKYEEEEVWAPEMEVFISIANDVYSREQILRMEKAILNTLEWSLSVPTHYVFLVRFARAAPSSDTKNDKEMENMVFFFAELALMQYELVPIKPSMVAAAAVYAARLTLKKTPLWTEALQHQTGFAGSELTDCVKIMVTAHSTARRSELKVVYQKYSSEKLGGVALRPPAIDFSANKWRFR
ncbi:hypothetical protein ZWY2020_012566 [Hordeum vulgare]|nr:hypothetical protein ZWY2020_012566 [Hordeum vulgare]